MPMLPSPKNGIGNISTCSHCKISTDLCER
jgi:hypothetical protein